MDKPTHQHKCLCGNVWEHGEDKKGDLEAHLCHNCGTIVTTKWNPNDEAGSKAAMLISILLTGTL